MTIARQTEILNENWSSWYLLQWFIPIGVSWDTTLWCAWSYSNWENWWPTWPTWNDCDNKRKLKLLNNEEIWDFAWNLWEHINKTNNINSIDGVDNLWKTSIWVNTSDTEWTDIDIVYRIRYASKFLNLDSNNWIWRVYNPNWVNNNVFIRWWSAWDGKIAWIYSLSLGIDSNSSDGNIGFRCVFY